MVALSGANCTSTHLNLHFDCANRGAICTLICTIPSSNCTLICTCHLHLPFAPSEVQIALAICTSEAWFAPTILSIEEKGRVRCKSRFQCANASTCRALRWLGFLNCHFWFCSFWTVPRIDYQILAGERPPKNTRTDHEPIQNHNFQK